MIDRSRARRVVAALALTAVLAVGVNTAFVGADQPSSQLRCELSQPGDFGCAYLDRLAGTVAPIPDGSIVRVVDAVGGPLRTALDIALVVISTPGAPTRLVLIGYVGIDIQPAAWIPDQTDYPAWYAKYVDVPGGPTAGAGPPVAQSSDRAAETSTPTSWIILVAAGIALFFVGLVFGRRRRSDR